MLKEMFGELQFFEIHVLIFTGAINAVCPLFPGDTILVRIRSIQLEQQCLSFSQRRIPQSEQIEWIRQRQHTDTMLSDDEEG